MIEIKNIVKSYGELKVLKGIDLTIKEKEIVTIVGASGAGKSTLLHILGTLDTPDEGELLYDSVNIARLSSNKLSEFRNNNIGFVFQFHHLLPEFTALENVCIPAWIKGTGKKEAEIRIQEMLEKFGLKGLEKHKPAELSGGQQRRAALAGVLAMDPEVLILDEPAAGLDPKGRDKILAQIKKYHDEYGKTILLVSHSMEDIVKYAGKVLVMNKSRLFCYDTVDRVFARTDELAKIGLDVPQITRMSHILKSLGTDIGNDIYTTQRAAERLLPLIR